MKAKIFTGVPKSGKTRTAITIDSLLLTKDYEECEMCEMVTHVDHLHYDENGVGNCNRCCEELAK